MELFAGTPPLEALKMMISIVASNHDQHYKLMHIDVSRAYFHAPVTRDIYVSIPAEDWEKGDDRKCAKLRLSMYGTRDAASKWERRYTQVLKAAGFKQGAASGCAFYHYKRRLSLSVHGDDFTIAGREGDLEWLRCLMAKEFKIKASILGGDVNTLKILNRTLRWLHGGIGYEIDPKHINLLVRTMKLDGAKGLMSLQSTVADEGSLERLGEDDTRKYRANAARLNYIAADRPDIQYVTKRVCQSMSCPTKADLQRMKKLVRFLIHYPEVHYLFRWQSTTQYVHGFSDSDWAGCSQSRKSTSGGCVSVGLHVIKSWSKMQSVVALSSAEAELYASVRTASETIGIKNLAADLGMVTEISLHIDAKATLGMLHRKGVGRVKHVDTNQLWLQDAVKSGQVVPKKVGTRENVADLMTKCLGAAQVRFLMVRMGFRYPPSMR